VTVSESPFPPNPFGQFDLSQMMQFLQVDGPVHWELARQMARWVAAGGATEAPPDPTECRRLDEIAAAAEARILAGTGIPPVARQIDTIGTGEMAERTLVSMRPVLERLALTLQSGPDSLASMEAAGPLAGMFGSLGPLLLGVQCGFMVGQLAAGVLSQHDLLLPVTGAVRPAFVVPNMAGFPDDWSIPHDDFRFHMALAEGVRSRICARPWVQQRLLRLAEDYVGSFHVDPSVMEAHFGALDLSNPSALEELMGNPEALLGAMQTPRQLEVLDRLQHTTAILTAYADAVCDRVGASMLPSLGLIREASARRRAERGEADRFLYRMLGVDTDQRIHRRAVAFCAGVVERAGDDGLDRLLEGEEFLPTPAELEAPGLWLARLELETDS
jgi:putative hydrolase